jgi:hypothetical protein
MKLVSIKPSTNSDKKLMATFSNGRTIHFGAKGLKDFTIYSKGDKDVAKQKKDAYIARHKVNENWNDPTTAGALSRWILWNLPTKEASIADFKKRFNL